MALVKCKQCGNENAKDAKTCPKCGTSLKMGIGKKILIGVGVLFALAVIGRLGHKDSASAATASMGAADPGAQATEPEQPTASTVDIASLLSEYKNNEVRADAEYKGKWISTTGVAGEVKKDILGSVYVTVGSGALFEIPQVQCFVAKDQVTRAAQYSKGDKVTIVGRVDGLMMNVLVKECRFQ